MLQGNPGREQRAMSDQPSATAHIGRSGDFAGKRVGTSNMFCS
jgi:hypothetical protein